MTDIGQRCPQRRPGGDYPTILPETDREDKKKAAANTAT